jgi:hypothetical protein
VAWVPIQRGCDHRCTYCIVPYVRGPEKNRSRREILDEVRGLAERGVTEVTLLGQTVNSYRGGGVAFPRLLRAVARVDGIRRVRFTSPHPNDVTPELVEVMATEPAVCEQLHLPAQSGNDRILKRMVRRYTVESFLEKVEHGAGGHPRRGALHRHHRGLPGRDRRRVPGHPGAHAQVRFDDAFTYRYSPREGTPATRLPPEEDFIPDAEAQARLEELIEVARGIQAEINRARWGGWRRSWWRSRPGIRGAPGADPAEQGGGPWIWGSGPSTGSPWSTWPSGGSFVGMVVMLLANIHPGRRFLRTVRGSASFRDPDEEELQGEEAARFGASGSTPPRGTEPATGLGQETSARPAPSADSVPPLRSDPPVGPESPVRPEPPARPGPSFPLDPPRSAEPSRGPESLSPGTPGEPGSGSVPVPPDRRGPPVT